MNYVITAKCTNGHTQDFVVDGWLGLDWAIEHANLMDGTSKFYLAPHPSDDPHSMIGKCGICKAKFFCRVKTSVPTSEDVNSSETN